MSPFFSFPASNFCRSRKRQFTSTRTYGFTTPSLLAIVGCSTRYFTWFVLLLVVTLSLPRFNRLRQSTHFFFFQSLTRILPAFRLPPFFRPRFKSCFSPASPPNFCVFRKPSVPFSFSPLLLSFSPLSTDSIYFFWIVHTPSPPLFGDIFSPNPWPLNGFPTAINRSPFLFSFYCFVLMFKLPPSFKTTFSLCLQFFWEPEDPRTPFQPVPPDVQRLNPPTD